MMYFIPKTNIKMMSMSMRSGVIIQECHLQKHTKKKIRMNSRLILISLFWFFVAHIAVWFQLNGQFKWDWFKNNEWVLALAGVPISFLYLWGTKYAVNGFDGLLWPGRFVGFGVGMVVYAIFTGYFFNEGITPKTAISLGLALLLISVQLFWK